MKISINAIISGAILTALSSIFVSVNWSLFGLFLVYTVLISFIEQLGKSIPLLELIATIVVLQLILGPIFAYHLPIPNFKYLMYVPEREYMEIVVPIIFAFILGLSFFQSEISFDTIKDKIYALNIKAPTLGMQLIFIGIVIDSFQGIFPSSLRFVAYLLYNLSFVGAILYFFDKQKKYKAIVIVLVLGYSLLKSLNHGVFHDFILWITLIVSIVALELKPTFSLKLLFFSLGFLFLFSLQAIKADLRSQFLPNDSLLTRVEMLSSSIVDPINNFTNYTDPQVLSSLNVRLNQGWIVSAIINYVPNVKPYANGATIEEAVYNAALPRFLNPNKAKASGRDNFQKYTGITLNNSTSMGVSLIGEAYINFGGLAWLFMFSWGAFLAWILQYFLSLGNNINPIFFILIPLLFLQVIKAETEFNTVLNHLVKAGIFILMLYSLYLKKYNLPILTNSSN